ncbi:hypothetical protein [Mycolicibacterium wolinskyi]|uniref:hypothetical protein n=1 Tax=Mycolicibacterium wolinskyi TaxID=59750 RepID=UPI003BAA42DE
MTNTLQSIHFGIGQSQPEVFLTREENPYYARAVRTDNYEHAKALRQKAIDKRLAHAATRPAGVPMPDRADADLDAWLEDVAAKSVERFQWEAQDSALVKLIAECNSNIQGASLDRDNIARALNNDLRQLMAQVDAVVDELGGARTPTAAIDAGTGNAWRKLSALRREYDLIRAAQDIVGSGVAEYTSARSNYLYDDPHASDTRIRNLDAFFEDWRDKKSNVTHVYGSDKRPQPWPADPVEQLVWFATNDVELWIPTVRQLESLWADRRRRRDPGITVIPQRPDRTSPPQGM